MAELEVWKDYVTVINAARMNAIRDHIITNEGNISYHQTLINANTTDICNLSNIKLSRDGSQPMTGELQCNSGIKADTIDTMTEAMLSCQKPLQIDSRLYGNSSVGLWLYSDFDIYAPSIRLYSYNSSLLGKILISTPGDDSPASTRIEIPGKADFVDIKFRESNVLPYDDNYQDLGNSSYRWKKVYGVEGIFSTSVKTNILDSPTGGTIFCQKDLIIKETLAGSDDEGLDLQSNIDVYAPYIKLYPESSSENGAIYIGTPGSPWGTVNRIEIPGDSETIDIKINSANIVPANDAEQDIGKTNKRWKNIYSNVGNFSNIIAYIGNFSGLLTCKSGLKTNTITTISGTAITCDKDLKINSHLWSDDTLILANGTSSIEHAQVKLEGRDISLSTPDSTGESTERLYIYGGWDEGLILIKNADVYPDSNASHDLGSNSNKWRKIYAKEGVFDIVSTPKTMPFHLENPSSSDKHLLGAGTVSTMYQFNTTITLTGYKLMILTSNSSGYIKVSIDDANGWTYEKTYSLGSAGGYRYNESFNHVIETTNGIQLKLSNCSNISSTTIVLEYK